MSSYKSAAPEMNSLANNFLDILAQQTQGTLESIPDETVQQLFSLVLKLYVNRLNDHPEMQPFDNGSGVTATEAVIAVTRILKQVNVEVFELAMWQTMGSIK